MMPSERRPGSPLTYSHLRIYREIADDTTGAFMAPADVGDLLNEIERLERLLMEGPVTAQECAWICKAARKDGDGKPCLDCALSE